MGPDNKSTVVIVSGFCSVVLIIAWIYRFWLKQGNCLQSMFVNTDISIIFSWYMDCTWIYLDMGLVIIINGAGDNIWWWLRFGSVESLLAVFVDGCEGWTWGAEHREVSWTSSSGALVDGGGGVEQGVARRQEGRAPHLCGPPQLVNMVLQLLQLLKMSWLQCCRVK